MDVIYQHIVNWSIVDLCITKGRMRRDMSIYASAA